MKLKLILVFVLSIMLAGCFEKEVKVAPKGKISGVVIDSEGIAVGGVKVTAGDKIAYTDGNGIFSISDIDVGGNPKYYLVFNKQNYVAASAEANFTSTLTIEDSGKIDGLPLDNSSAYVKVTMVEIVTLISKLKSPSGENLSTTSSIKVIPEIEMALQYQKYVPKSGYKGEINNSAEIKIKDVPRLGVESTTSGTAIKSIKIKVYENNSLFAGYYGEIEDKTTLNLEGREKTISAPQNEIVMPDITLKRYYTIKGTVFGDPSQITATIPVKVSGAKVKLKKGNNIIKEVNADLNGAYIFSELESGDDYEIILESFDSNGDGRAEYINTKQFDKVVLTGTNPEITRNISFEGKFMYSISGKVFMGIKELNEFKDGVRVNLTSDDKYIASVVTTTSGVFSFKNVNYKNVKVYVDDIDLNNNGIADFKGYNENDAETKSAVVEINNTSSVEINSVEIIMPANSQEPDHFLEIKSTPFAEKNREGALVSVSNAIAVGGKIEIIFNNDISELSVADIIKEGKDPFTISDKKSGVKIDTTYAFGIKKDALGKDVKDLSKVLISPVKNFAYEQMTLDVSKDLSSVKGYKYKLENQINAKYKEIAIDTDIEDYYLEVSTANFAEKGASGFTTKGDLGQNDNLIIGFSSKISTESKNEIENSGDKVMFLKEGSLVIPGKISITGDGSQLTFDPDIALKAGVEYQITINTKLASIEGYKYGLDMGSNSFNIKGTIIKGTNTTLSAITPALGMFYGINKADYPEANFVLDYNLTGGLYRNIDTNSSEYLDNVVRLENGVAGTSDYSAAGFPIVFPIPEASITSEGAINDISEFRIYGKMKSADSFWSLLKTIKTTEISKAEILNKLSKIYIVDLKTISGYSTIDKLGYGNEIHLTVIPVDMKGKGAEFDTAKKLTLKDTYAPKIDVSISGDVIIPGYNSIAMNENIDSSKTYSIDITGINENVKYKVEDVGVGDFNKLVYRITLEDNGRTSLADFNPATAVEVTNGSGVYRLGVNKADGLYDGIILSVNNDDTKKITVKKIEKDDSIQFAFLGFAFNIPSGAILTYANDNTSLISRNNIASDIHYTASSNVVIKKYNVAIKTVTTGAVTMDTTLLTNPLLGYKNGDVLAFNNASGSAVSVTIKSKNDDGKSFTTDSNVDSLNGSYELESKNQLFISNGMSYFINEKVLLRKSSISDKEATVLEIDSIGQTVAVDADITAYNGGQMISKSVDDTALTVILSENKKIMTGDKLVFNKNIYAVSNPEYKVTKVTPVHRTNGTYLYKYEFAGQDISAVKGMFNSLVTGSIATLKAEYIPQVAAKCLVSDTSGNVIQSDNDELFYNVYTGFPGWSTR